MKQHLLRQVAQELEHVITRQAVQSLKKCLYECVCEWCLKYFE